MAVRTAGFPVSGAVVIGLETMFELTSYRFSIQKRRQIRRY